MSSIPQQTDERALPCVLPQINHSFFGGKYNSPFVRAYAPALSTYGIPETSFLAFLDGLNESFVTNPALETATHIGMGISAFGGPHGHIIGKAVKMAAKTASSGMSSKRTKVYLEEVNRDLFVDCGLKVEILPTYAMLQVIGCSSDQFQQGQFEAAGLGVNRTLQQREQTQLDRMRALDGRVMQLTYHIHTQPPTTSNSWAQNQAAKKAAKQHEKQSEDLAKAHEKRNEKIREATSHHDKDMAEYTHELHKLQEKLADELRKDASSPGKQEKAKRKYAEEVRKLDKDKGQGKFAEEMKEADDEVLKLRKDEGKEVKYLEWLVITPVGWVNQVQGNHGAMLQLKAGEQVKKHLIKSLFG
jgi:hypothetical protein